jgi:hypothetical protein
MRCESAVHAVTSEDLLLSARQSPSALRYPIHGLGGCGIPETVTHPSTNRGGRCLTSLAETNVVPQAPRRLLNYSSSSQLDLLLHQQFNTLHFCKASM